MLNTTQTAPVSQSTRTADHPKARPTFRKTRIALYAHDADTDCDIPICYKSAFYIIDLVNSGRAEWLTPKSARAIQPGQTQDNTKRKSAHADWYTESVSRLPANNSLGLNHLRITTKQLDA